ncbi:MAG: PAS domain S-box protein [Campylobacterota bacterium]|nr:PAS domain S-box protein [Campylobacterota bacterium]
MKLSVKYILIYIITVVITLSALWYEKEHKIQQHLKIESQNVEKQYNIIYNEYKKIANILYNTKINTSKVINIFKDAKSSDKIIQDKTRQKLYLELDPTYRILKNYNLKQLHFHLPDNKSFLRFHRPKKYGDDLTYARDTVNYVNNNKKKIDGFEQGKIYDGFKFVFPIFNGKEYLGSVETSFSTLALITTYQKSFYDYANFLLPKNKVKERVFKSEVSNYQQAHFESFYIEKKVNDKVSKTDLFNNMDNLGISHKEIEEKLLNKERIVLYNDLHEYHFLPVLNPVTETLEGVFIAVQKHHYITDKIKNFNTISTILILLLSISIYFLYRINIYKHNITEQNNKLNTVINEADSGIGIMDINGNFLEVNDNYSTLLGYTKDELLKLNCVDLTADEQKELAKEYLQKALKDGKLSKVHKICNKKDGSAIHLEFSLKLLPQKNAFIVVINSMEDKIQLKKLNENLIEEVGNQLNEIRHKDVILQRQSMDAAMGEMIDAIAHQWKGPLNAIKLNTQLYEFEFQYNDTPDIEKLKKVSYQIDEQIDHLLDTLESFRSFFRPDQTFEDIELSKIVESVLMLTKDELIKNNIETNITGDTDLKVSVIPNEFKHIIINLISNSKDAFNENDIKSRDITFEILKTEKNAILKVCDTAGGIPENIIDNIFKANFTTKEKGKGTGIGLYMTKQIIDKNNADVKVYSIDNGVCFEITLPCV